MLVEEEADALREVVVGEAARVDVHRDAEREAVATPGSALSRNLGEHVVADLDAEAALLGEGHELVGGEQAERRMPPPGERLGRDDLAAAQVESGLVVEEQLAARDEPAQLAGEPAPVGGGGRRRGVEDRVADACALRVVHRGVGPMHERLRVGPVLRMDCDADARADVGGRAVEVDRLVQCPLHAKCAVERAFEVDAAEHDAELVAAESRDRVARPQRAGHPLRDRAQHGVTRGVAVRVVDLLEPVDVDHHHGDSLAVPARLSQRDVEPVVEERPVREPGERVVEREKLRFLTVGLRPLLALPERDEEPDDHRREQRLDDDCGAGAQEERRRREDCREQADCDEAVEMPRRRSGGVSNESRDGAAGSDSRAAVHARQYSFDPSAQPRRAAHPDGGGSRPRCAKVSAPRRWLYPKLDGCRCSAASALPSGRSIALRCPLSRTGGLDPPRAP